MVKKKQVNKILVVDDEKDIVDILKYNLLQQKEFEVLSAYNGKDAIKIAQEEKPDLILLDIMMPELNGFDVCKKLKSLPQTADIPVIFLTAKENEIDEIIGLELGADDYIKKPLSPRKIIARVKSVLRRVQGESEKLPKTPDYVKFKGIEIDSVSHTVKVDGEEVFFPKKEFKLLHFLISNRGKVFSREVILNEIWGENVYVVDRTIDVHIAKIREKLGDYADYIETLKGIGYRFNDD